MFKLNLYIALRNLWKNKVITLINVGGLAVALTAFILIMLYFNFETSFDKDNPNYSNIYQLGRIYPDFKTNNTAPPMARAIKENFPEVERAGIIRESTFEMVLRNANHSIVTKNFIQVDYDAAQILNILPDGGLNKPAGENDRLNYLSQENMRALFPEKRDDKAEIAGAGSSNSGITTTINGTIRGERHSNITFDGLSIANVLGQGEDYGQNNYFSYIQVRPGTNIKNLESKITKLYRKELLKGERDLKTVNEMKQVSTFLDPLSNLHLRPAAGNDTPYKILIALSGLGVLILVIACINFTNLSIAQANRRAKEVGVKKVLGAQRSQLSFQFLTEIFMQCLSATLLALILAELFLPSFNNLFDIHLHIWTLDNDLIWELPLVLLLITFVAGIYPAMVLSGFKPALVLKGNFYNSAQSYWLRNSLLVVQFSIAVIFITSLIVISTQLKYMRTEDLGFNTNQVVYVKNLALYTKPSTFKQFRERVLKIPGVSHATVASSIPDGSEAGSNTYSARGVEANLDFVDVDFDYFETLDIKIKEGRFFSPAFGTDTAGAAVINESAVSKFNMSNPVGQTIRGCDRDYTIVGVVKDFKSQGFENAVQPTIYTINNSCGNAKIELMLKIEQSKMSAVLASLKQQWPQINPKDGEDFRYEFLDQLYGRLFKKQEQLQSVFFAASLLAICIAMVGLFAFAKYVTNGRLKEIALRKILGASDLQIFRLINHSFLLMVLIANLVSWPIAYILIDKWLATFAYRIELPLLPFVLSSMITIVLTVLTVSLQARKAVNASPVEALKYE